MQAITRGYTHGLLNFEYTTPYSEARENYLVSWLENETMAEVLRTKAILNSQLITVSQGSKEIIKETFDTFKDYVEILLPSNKKPDKLKEMTSEDRGKLRDTLKQLKQKRAVSSNK